MSEMEYALMTVDFASAVKNIQMQFPKKDCG